MSEFLAEAVAIGDRLARSAIHHEDRCTWITRAVPYPSQDRPGDQFPELLALNPSVYSGTAGMALYFARLWSFSAEPAHRRTAAAALHHALRHAWHTDDSPLGALGGRWRFGFYLGTLGIAWTAWEASRLLDEPRYAREAARLVRELAATVDRPGEPDVMFGPAGGIPALLAMEAGGIAGAGTLAVRLGDRLLADAVRGDDGWSWGLGGTMPDRPNLTGYSHGTAGIGAALAALFGTTREERFRAAALEAFGYERARFDATEQNWPNYQLVPRADGTYPCSLSWCHGAPGIGVSRVVAAAYLDDGDLATEAKAAAETTRSFLRAELDFPGKDHMLCHGIAGHLECLWLIEDGLGDTSIAERMRIAGRDLIGRYGEPARARWGTDVEWPTGVANGAYPPLLTGVAGIGHWLLRLHAPDRVPTVLVPGAATPA